jgi:hypothetical protein
MGSPYLCHHPDGATELSTSSVTVPITDIIGPDEQRFL